MSQSTDSILNSLPYQCDFLDSLPAYNTWIGNIERLDLARDIINSNGYRYQGVVFPTRDLIVTNSYATYGIPPYGQQDGVVNVGRGSVLVSIATYCSDPLGFKYGVFDNATKDRLIETEVVRSEVAGYISSTSPMDATLPTYLGPMFLDTPYVLTHNGGVALRVNNLSPGYNIAQILLNFAVPKKVSIAVSGK